MTKWASSLRNLKDSCERRSPMNKKPSLKDKSGKKKPLICYKCNKPSHIIFGWSKAKDSKRLRTKH